jgi:hypothetical protein
VCGTRGVETLRAIRPALLLDPEPSWALERLLLGLTVVAASAGAGALAASAFVTFGRMPGVAAPLAPLPLSKNALVVFFALALLAGAFFRFAGLDALPPSLWEDDVSLIAPSLALSGSLRDFADSVRPVMYGISGPYGSVGVLYMELYRVLLQIWGTTVFGVRFVSAASGVLSLVTAAWLGRALLARGGGTLAAVILAGLRWHLILSRWGWNMILLAPLVDLAGLLALRARRKGSLLAAAAAGLVMGFSAHVYLAAWIAAAALFGLLLWPSAGLRVPARARLAACYFAALALAAAPLFVFREGRVFPYLRRVGHHNVFGEMSLWKSRIPPLAAAADAAVSPWLISDPTPRHDLPGRTRLGWILGAAVAIALARALLAWREDLSAFLLVQAAAAFAAAIVGGQYGLPNGSRFGYLTDTTAIAASGGALWILGRLRRVWRRPGAIAAVGVFAALSLLGARDAMAWARGRETFESFGGQDTLIGRAAARWDRLGAVAIDAGLGHPPDEVSDGTIASVRRFRLDPEEPRLSRFFDGVPRRGDRSFRIVSPSQATLPGERPVELVRDEWGRPWAVVLGRSSLG